MCTIIFYLIVDEDVFIFYDVVEDVEELSFDEEVVSKFFIDFRIVVLRIKFFIIIRKRVKIRNGKVSSEVIVV